RSRPHAGHDPPRARRRSDPLVRLGPRPSLRRRQGRRRGLCHLRFRHPALRAPGHPVRRLRERVVARRRQGRQPRPRVRRALGDRRGRSRPRMAAERAGDRRERGRTLRRADRRRGRGARPVSDRVTSLRPLIPGVYLPSLLFEIGVGAVLPMVPVVASSLGADLATAGLIAALLPIGHILADVPAGALAARFGDRAAMIGSSGAAMVGAVLAGLAGALGSLPLLALGVLLLGGTEAVYGLA